MKDPPHPGEILREYLGDITVTVAANHLGVSRATLQRVVSCADGVSPDMAYRLASAFGNRPKFWAGLQMQYDLHQAGQVKRPKIKRLYSRTEKAVEDNPDLPPHFVSDTLLAIADANAGHLTEYKSSRNKN